MTRRLDNFKKLNEEYVEAQKKEFTIIDQELSKKTFYEQDKRVIFMLKTSLFRLESKN